MPSLFETLIGEATLLTARGNLLDATAAIQRALSGSPAMPTATGASSGADPSVLDGLVREVTDRPSAPVRSPGQQAPREAAAAAATDVPAADRFEAHQHSGRFGTRSYKLFVPGGREGRALPLIVMLHGCSQSPDDFAAGTRMNEIAQERGFLVLYPAQAPRSNQSKCWNWFAPADQRRDGGEPALLAELTRHVAATHGADPRRVYVAGLSAGAAMADILGREYPDVFAAVGVHSGLPQGAAHDVASAFAVMRNGVASSGPVAAAMPFPREPARAPRGCIGWSQRNRFACRAHHRLPWRRRPDGPSEQRRPGGRRGAATHRQRNGADDDRQIRRRRQGLHAHRAPAQRRRTGGGEPRRAVGDPRRRTCLVGRQRQGLLRRRERA